MNAQNKSKTEKELIQRSASQRLPAGYMPITSLAAFTAAGSAFHSLNAVGGRRDATLR